MFKILSICKGGGYMYCRTEPIHPKANTKGLYPLHRVLLENKIGRLLNINEIAHHINGNKSDNSDENIELKDRSEHSKLHMPVGIRIECCCSECGNKIYKVRSQVRHNKKRGSKHFCNRKCSGKYYNPKGKRVGYAEKYSGSISGS